MTQPTHPPRYSGLTEPRAPIGDRLINLVSLYAPLSRLQMGLSAAHAWLSRGIDDNRSARRRLDFIWRYIAGPVNRLQRKAAAARRGLHRVRASVHEKRSNKAISRIETVAQTACAGSGESKVVHFGPTARTNTVTFCGMAMHLISWGLRLSRIELINYTCRRGLSRCMGGHPDLVLSPPSCEGCLRLSDLWCHPDSQRALNPPDGGFANGEDIETRSIEELRRVRHGELPLGEMIVPSLRWSLRRFHLIDNPSTRRLFAQYLRSAIHLADDFQSFLAESRPDAVIVFNGIFYPERTAREIARLMGIPVYTYEHGHLPYTMFFSPELACDVALRVPAEFQMDEARSARFDDYLTDRFGGGATMGSVRFFDTVEALPAHLVKKAKAYRRVVSAFTNVAFDTSHINANYLFESMFDWAAEVAALAAEHPDTLFIIRAHPSEARKSKPSAEPVADWLREQGLLDRPNLVAIPPDHFVNSYDLIELSDLVLVYNSTIGLEALIFGKPMINAGLPKYRFESFAHRFSDRQAYLSAVKEAIASPPAVDLETQALAKRFMYYLYFSSSLDFAPFFKRVTGARWLVRPDLAPNELHPEGCLEIDIVRHGIQGQGSFHYD